MIELDAICRAITGYASADVFRFVDDKVLAACRSQPNPLFFANQIFAFGRSWEFFTREVKMLLLLLLYFKFIERCNLKLRLLYISRKKIYHSSNIVSYDSSLRFKQWFGKFGLELRYICTFCSDPT